MTEQPVKTRIIDQRWFIRLLEIIPGSITWLTIIGPVVLSLFVPVVVAYFIIAFDLYWTFKSFHLGYNLISGYRRLHRSERTDWTARLEWLENPAAQLAVCEEKLQQVIDGHPLIQRRWIGRYRYSPRTYRKYRGLVADRNELQELVEQQQMILSPHTLINVVIIATYNESKAVLESSIKALTHTAYPAERLVLVLAYEERGGERVEQNAHDLIAEYRYFFRYAVAIKHPDGQVGEVRGKGANISYAGRLLAEWVAGESIDPQDVIVTTFDSDHRPGHYYFSLLTYLYATDPNRTRKSFQPIPMFYNNIWDAPAPMRVIAAGNSFWLLMETMRPNRLRNFAAHAQSLQALIHTDFWSVTTIVEDGHQYWRTYFTYEGDHHVVPVYAPVYQDAVLADTYWKTFKVQYIQLRRWAWGVSDFPFVVRSAIRHKHIPWRDKLLQLGRLSEGHFSWATASLLITFPIAQLPLYLNHKFSQQALAHQLPVITSYILRVALVGALITIYLSLISLPPRPPRYRRTKLLGMLLQWILLPVTALIFSSFAAIDAQTRLMLGKPLEFYVTEKARRE